MRPIESPINLTKCHCSSFFCVKPFLQPSPPEQKIKNSLLNEPLQKSSCCGELIRSALKWFIRDLDFRSALLVQLTWWQCFKQRLTNYHQSKHGSSQHPLPDQWSGDREIKSFLSSVISCQPSWRDARSGAGISTTEWCWEGADMLEEMLKAIWD